MLILKSNSINNSPISIPQLQQIQLDLAKKDSTSFETIIVDSFFPKLLAYINANHSNLQAESKDILEDVFLRFKKVLRYFPIEDKKIEITEQLLHLIKQECSYAIASDDNRKKNLNLNRGEFKSLVRKLQVGEDTLIEKVYLNHFKRCVSFLMRHCLADYEGAYACTMEALLEIRKDLIAGKIFYGNLSFYFTKRAKNKWYKFNMKSTPLNNPESIEGLDFQDEEKIESTIQQQELKAMVDFAFQQLCGDCKKIIQSYYYKDMSLKEIANSMDKTHDAVRKQITRCRDKLRKHLSKKFYHEFSALLNK